MSLDTRRTAPTVVAVLAVSLLTTGSIASGAEYPDLTNDPTPQPLPTPLAEPYLAGTWSAIPDAPWGSTSSAAAYTGREMLVVDLETGRAQTYDPLTEVWTQHEPAPKTFDVLSPSVWTGSELIVFDRHKPGRVFAYNPEARNWRRLARSPLKEQWTAEWADGQVVVGGRKTDVATYDVETDTWRTLANAPGGRRIDGLFWTGDALLALTSGNEKSRAQVAALDLGSDEWAAPVKGPVNGLFSSASWIGNRLLFASDTGWRDAVTDATFDPASGTWTEQDYDCPIWSGGALWNGEVLVGEYGGIEPRDDGLPWLATFGHVALDPDTGACIALPGRDVWEAVTEHGDRSWMTSLSTGDALIYWSGANEGGRPAKTDGVVFWFEETPAE